MSNIKPVSALRNYSDVLKDVKIGTPVFLTENGREKYVIMDIVDYEKNMCLDEERILRASGCIGKSDENS